MALPIDALTDWMSLAECAGLADALRRGERELELSGLPAAAAVALGLVLWRRMDRPLVLLVPDWPTAETVAESADAWLGGAALRFPSREFLPYTLVAQSPEVHTRRLATLTTLVQGPAGPPPVLVLPVSALRRQLPPPAQFAAAVLHLAPGMPGDPPTLARRLAAAGYQRQPLAEAPGTFAQRGGIVDVFPVTAEAPLRVEFGPESVTSLRAFAPDSQRTLDDVPSALVAPAREVPAPAAADLPTVLERLAAARGAQAERLDGEARERLAIQVEEDLQGLQAGTAPGLWENYLPFSAQPTSILAYITARWPRPLCVVVEAGTAMESLGELSRHDGLRLGGFLEEGRVLPEQAEAFTLPADFRADIARGAVLYADSLGRSVPGVRGVERVALAARGTPPFAGQWALALDGLRRWERAEYRTVCWVGGAERARRLVRELDEAGLRAVVDEGGAGDLAAGTVTVRVGHMPAGFELPGLRLAVLGEQNLFGTRRRPARVRRVPSGARLQGYEDLGVGDYVVHVTHGIGQYLGTQSMSVQGKTRDYLVLRYEGTDRLYVPTDQVGLVQKYIGGESRQVRVSRLGGAEWARTKQRVKESVQKMAEELLTLYAARQTLRGHAFAPDGDFQRQFEDAFAYEETPDQLQAIAEIKADMEQPTPMDRLLCGDVGYGKTEVPCAPRSRRWPTDVRSRCWCPPPSWPNSTT